MARPYYGCGAELRRWHDRVFEAAPLARSDSEGPPFDFGVVRVGREPATPTTPKYRFDDAAREAELIAVAYPPLNLTGEERFSAWLHAREVLERPGADTEVLTLVSAPNQRADACGDGLAPAPQAIVPVARGDTDWAQPSGGLVLSGTARWSRTLAPLSSLADAPSASVPGAGEWSGRVTRCRLGRAPYHMHPTTVA